MTTKYVLFRCKSLDNIRDLEIHGSPDWSAFVSWAKFYDSATAAQMQIDVFKLTEETFYYGVMIIHIPEN